MFKQESKTFKLTFMASSTWRKIFLIKYNDLHQKKKSCIWSKFGSTYNLR